LAAEAELTWQDEAMAEGSCEQHLALGKQRALAYLDAGDLRLAWLAMTSDVRRHPGPDARPPPSC
jgi:hypothetical protein